MNLANEEQIKANTQFQEVFFTKGMFLFKENTKETGEFLSVIQRGILLNWRGPLVVVVNELDCDIVVSEFELQSQN